MRVADRMLFVVAPAAALASLDLIVKRVLPTAGWAFHQRSGAYVVFSLALFVAAVGLSVVPSQAVALASGVMGAGVLGNLVSASANSAYLVPNPLKVGLVGNTIVFNLADVFFMLGNVFVTATLMAAAIRHRNRLNPARGWERALLQRLRA